MINSALVNSNILFEIFKYIYIKLGLKKLCPQTPTPQKEVMSNAQLIMISPGLTQYKHFKGQDI